MLNSVWLNSFVTLCETGHFTRAAARLNMTQPGISQHLKKLEEQVGQPLLSRDGKSFIPTPAGEAVLELGQRRRVEEAALRDALRHDDPQAGEVSLACSGAIALLVYPRLIALMRAAPKLVVRLEAAPQARIAEGVAAGVFDLGVIGHPPGQARLEGVEIGADSLCLALPPGSTPRPGIADLQELGFIGHPDGSAYADELLSANYPEDYPGAEHLNLRSFVNQIGQILEPVAQGIGFTVLPRSGIDAYPGRQRLTLARLPTDVRHPQWLVQRRGRALPRRAEALRAVLREALRDR
ncbi:LysR family transcriptional regulator [Salipiger mangrovisoli]|uniref:LysR family transcriptional regulator n=1 Tax=Salipiger mangrovisoli TaxID=2865933 RepID=A0ABR9WYI7_9RHOB|nr:LysR family transcriptional regulator [Salipiger mangrovisoli]MBE9636353.1 LysR family transcriptional regulator [Salipiger mangrovisoli]